MTMPSALNARDELSGLLETMQRLRDPNGGCPWDLEQTHASLRPSMLEESYEAMEAVGSGDVQAMVEELGDLLIQVVFHGQIGLDNGTFSLADVARHAKDKLVRRHPHVFGQDRVSTAEEVKRHWDRLKALEREAKGQGERSMLDGVPTTMPALAYAQAVQDRVDRAGLQWQHPPLGEAMTATMQRITQEPAQDRREAAFGQLLFSLVAQARTSGVDAEQVLRTTNKGFYRGIAGLERESREKGVPLDSLSARGQT